jgi:arabinogalactan endo-1,4-beta-galactosidase
MINRTSVIFTIMKTIRCIGSSLNILVAYLSSMTLYAQQFYFGNDLSYVNEMEDCGVVYRENGASRDVYDIFADHGCNLVRLRLWHTPAWYDSLNQGHRYGDLADVKRAIARARAKGMHVLLNFHLSDNWADPSKQIVPAAWDHIVDDLPVLKDSLYNYISSTLLHLHGEALLPEMVQIGNETNRGILLSQEQNDAGWVLDWPRNSQLFNSAIQAVRDVEQATGETVVIALHAAGPEDATWIYSQFIENGVTDFDVMGISYYWAWHKPTTIAQTGEIIRNLRTAHPGYEVMIFETGYIWTTQNIDQAANIITETHPDYHPASPDNQRRWLVDLTQEVINSGGKAVIYWEPAWVSSPCRTQWGQGSHQEHATFFDFNHQLMPSGGVAWMSWQYQNLSSVIGDPANPANIRISADTQSRRLYIDFGDFKGKEPVRLQLITSAAQIVHTSTLQAPVVQTRQHEDVPALPTGIYFVRLTSNSGHLITQSIRLYARR